MTDQQVDERIVARPLSELMGLEVDVDLSKPMSEERFRTIFDLFNHHQVLVFRNQRISKHDLVLFGSRFGRIAGHVLHGRANEDYPEVHVISNVDKDGRISGIYPDENNFAFHTDKSYMPIPALATLLYGVEVPANGGDTLFANMYRAYDALDAGMKSRIENLVAVHNLDHSRTKGRRMSDEEKRAAPPTPHRLVQLHPVTRMKFLFCGSHAESIIGLSRDEGRLLLDQLLAHATRPEFVYAHRWQQRDLVMWDNRCLLHGATMFDVKVQKRIVHRVVVERDF